MFAITSQIHIKYKGVIHGGKSILSGTIRLTLEIKDKVARAYRIDHVQVRS